MTASRQPLRPGIGQGAAGRCAGAFPSSRCPRAVDPRATSRYVPQGNSVRRTTRCWMPRPSRGRCDAALTPATGPACPCARRPPAGPPGEDRRAAGQPRHAGQLRLLVDAALSERIPVGQAGGRLRQLEVAAASAAGHPDEAAVLSGANYKLIWNHEHERKPAADDHQGPDRRDRRGDRRPARRRGHGRFLHALRQPVDRHRRCGRWSRRAARRSCSSRFTRTTPGATSATANDQFFRALMKEKRQPAVRTVPEYFDHPLYIDALAQSVERRLCRAGSRAGRAGRQLPRDAEALPDGGRPLPLPVRQDLAPAARTAGLGEGGDRHHLPVGLRAGGMAEALYGRACGRAGEGRARSGSR